MFHIGHEKLISEVVGGQHLPHDFKESIEFIVDCSSNISRILIRDPLGNREKFSGHLNGATNVLAPSGHYYPVGENTMYRKFAQLAHYL